jgi:uncharacterized protein
MDFYAIPFEDQHILYRPLRRLAFVGNAGLISYVREQQAGRSGGNEEIDTFLDSVGFWRPGLSCDPAPNAEDVRPTQAVLLMTNRCNLRCTYCYADGGAAAKVEQLAWEPAKAVIDAVLANATDTENQQSGLTFHGGGEPTLHWDLLERAVAYVRDRSPSCSISCSSNGVWSDRKREFICEHFDNVSLSMDGVEAVQNAQRPSTGGRSSFSSVMESIAGLDEGEVDYGIRMTVLPESVDQVADGVRFLCENTSAATIQIEPTFTSSRGTYADLAEDFADAFASNFMEAWRAGVAANRQVYYSGARPWVVSCAFCLAPVKALCVTPDAKLVTCFEVFSGALPQASPFVVGYVREGRVEHDVPALRAFLAETNRRRESCRQCFCYWHCCGDCMTRREVSAPMTSGRCRVTREVTRQLLASYIAEGDGVWMGIRETEQGESP